ncbi:MAG: CHAT domain-containing protein [Phormidesmis sp.]
MGKSHGDRSINIGGNVDGSAIVVGDGNTVSRQTSHQISRQTSNQASIETSSVPSTAPSKRKLLILAASPQGSSRLRLDEEVREISEGLKRAAQRDAFEIAQRWAVRPRDFQRAMLEERPQIVHFSGQHKGAVGLHFETETGGAQRVDASALAALFKLFSLKAKTDCVVLSRCYAPDQAAAIAQYVPYVVGMMQSMDDSAAIEFVVGFYDALGNGESVAFAFESGKVAMALNASDCAEMPVLLSND